LSLKFEQLRKALSLKSLCNKADGLLKMKQQGFKRMMVKRDVLRYHNAKVQTHLKTTVFNRGGCSSYYLDRNGRNFAAWPWSLAELKQRLSALELKHYDVVEA
jgi:hypothetical protein